MRLPPSRGERWLIRALALVALGSSPYLLSSPLLPSGADGEAVPAADQRISFNITSQPLATALPLFIRQSGVDALIYAQRDLGDNHGLELIGHFSLEAGLRLLLQTSPLSFERLANGTIIITPAPAKNTPLPTPQSPRQTTGRGIKHWDLHSDTLEEVVTIGTRVKGRTITETAVPVDILAGDMLQQIGSTGLGEQLQSLAPSFNFSRTTVSDGTDFVRPATLRGLSPDQMLVLINGKRRHSQAQINIQQSVGRGSAGTDINAIPLAAIERVEVLRDGAAAQYGSDAIAGVINIVLKNDTEQASLQASVGRTREGDGDASDLSLNHGWDLQGQGFVNLTLQSQRRDSSNRAGVDNRFDPPRVSMNIGEPESDFQALFINGAVELSSGEIYAFAGLSRREGKSAGFYRGAGARADAAAVSARYLPELFPEGFLPLQRVDVDDDSLTLGWVTALDDHWQMDTSISYGRNRFTQGTERSVNVSLGADSPTAAENGYLEFQQLSGNWDLRGQLNSHWSNTLFLAMGLEYREEKYRVQQGEFASYAYGPSDDFDEFIASPVDPCPQQQGPQNCANGASRSQAQAGMQAFPGFRSNVSAERDSLALYLDAETNVSEQLRLGAAIRLEHYQDVGNNATGKLSLHYQLTGQMALRGALSSGFRAPGLNQRAFTNVLTNIGPDLLTETLHAAEGSAAVQALGVSALQEERSRHLSLGMVWTPRADLSLALDWYHIEINDRIVMTDVIAEESVSCINAHHCPLGDVLDNLNQNIGAVQFFTNAIDTRTQGADLVISNGWSLVDGSRLHLSATAHINQTEVLDISPPAEIAPEVLFSQAQVDLIETGQPRQRLSLGLDWSRERWQARVQFNRYGKIKTSYFTEPSLGVDVPGAEDTAHKSNAAWLTDIDLTYRFHPQLQLAVGATNLFDVRPDKLASNSVPTYITGGSFVYPWESTPYGIQGAYYYTRLQLFF